MKIQTAKEIAAIQKSEKVVIVASRRTDIPAFHVEELLDGLRKGAFHPQGLMQAVWEFRFEPEDIHSVGLWSQNFGPWIERGEARRLGYRFWYRFSILPDDPVCKPKAPPVAQQLAQLERLADADGPEAVFLFVDPIAKYRKAGATGWKYNFSEGSLGRIFQKAKELGIAGVSTSILDHCATTGNPLSASFRRGPRHSRPLRHPHRPQAPQGLVVQGRIHATGRVRVPRGKRDIPFRPDAGHDEPVGRRRPSSALSNTRHHKAAARGASRFGVVGPICEIKENDMILTPEEFAFLLPLAVEWAERQENRILEEGIPLTEPQLAIARQVDVKAPDRVRLLHVREIPLPEHRELRETATMANLITPHTIGLALRYGIFVRAGWENDRRLVAHELAHTMQYERAGSFDAFLAEYLRECLTVGYPEAPLEKEAIAIEQQIAGRKK